MSRVESCKFTDLDGNQICVKLVSSINKTEAGTVYMMGAISLE